MSRDMPRDRKPLLVDHRRHVPVGRRGARSMSALPFSPRGQGSFVPAEALPEKKTAMFELRVNAASPISYTSKFFAYTIGNGVILLNALFATFKVDQASSSLLSASFNVIAAVYMLLVLPAMVIFSKMPAMFKSRDGVGLDKKDVALLASYESQIAAYIARMDRRDVTMQLSIPTIILDAGTRNAFYQFFQVVYGISQFHRERLGGSRAKTPGAGVVGMGFPQTASPTSGGRPGDNYGAIDDAVKNRDTFSITLSDEEEDLRQKLCLVFLVAGRRQNDKPLFVPLSPLPSWQARSALARCRDASVNAVAYGCLFLLVACMTNNSLYGQVRRWNWLSDKTSPAGLLVWGSVLLTAAVVRAMAELPIQGDRVVAKVRECFLTPLPEGLPKVQAWDESQASRWLRGGAAGMVVVVYAIVMSSFSIYFGGGAPQDVYQEMSLIDNVCRGGNATYPNNVAQIRVTNADWVAQLNIVLHFFSSIATLLAVTGPAVVRLFSPMENSVAEAQYASARSANPKRYAMMITAAYAYGLAWGFVPVNSTKEAFGLFVKDPNSMYVLQASVWLVTFVCTTAWALQVGQEEFECSIQSQDRLFARWFNGKGHDGSASADAGRLSRRQSVTEMTSVLDRGLPRAG